MLVYSRCVLRARLKDLRTVLCPVMLVAAFVILGVVDLLGSVLAVLHLRVKGAATPRAFRQLIASRGYCRLMAPDRG
jgi:hypothetical protein